VRLVLPSSKCNGVHYTMGMFEIQIKRPCDYIFKSESNFSNSLLSFYINRPTQRYEPHIAHTYLTTYTYIRHTFICRTTMTLSAQQDCYGSPLRETMEQISTKKTSARTTTTITTPRDQQDLKQQQTQKLRSPEPFLTTPVFAMTTNCDAATGGRTSARATRGRPSTGSRNDSSREPKGRSNKSRVQAQEPRTLDPSLEQQQEDPSSNSSSSQNYIINLPPSLLPHWCTLLICSTLSLAAVAAGTPLTTSSSSATDLDEAEGIHYENLQMVLAIATLSLMLTFLASACYIWIPASFVGTLYEVTVVSETIPLTTGSIVSVRQQQELNSLYVSLIFSTRPCF
jgi:hypothetical protein